MSDWYPNLEGQLPDGAVRAVRRVLDLLYAVGGRVGKMEAAKFLPRAEAERRYAATATARALSVEGQGPLNVTGLVGQLAQPQKAYVPFVDVLPNVLHDPMSQDGALVSYNGVVYWFDGRTEPGRWRALGAAAVFLSDTHANRLANFPASDYPIGTVFWETDRTVLYENQGTYGASNWVYILGTMRGAQAAIAGLGLGQYDDGVLFECTDYNHVLRWAWGGGPGAFGWGPGENGSAYVQFFAVAPTGVGWKLADGAGSPVAYLLATGGTATVALPDLRGSVYPKGAAAYTGAVDAAVDPTISGDTGAGAAHSHGVGTLDAAAASAGTPSGVNADESTHTHGPGDFVTSTPSASGAVQSGAGTSVALNTHVHSIASGNSDPGAAHTHAFAGDAMASHDHALSGATAEESAHTHGAGTLAATGGAPASIGLLPYFRI